MKNMQFTKIPESEESLLEIAKTQGLSTGRDRLEEMRPQCGFGELGTCCKMCYMGPCRIDPFGEGAKVGVCGASPDTIVARNLLRECVGGSASHSGHARHVLLTMRDGLEGKAPYRIKDEAKLMALAGRFNIPTEGRSVVEIGKDLVKIALEDFGKQDGSPNNWLMGRAPKKEIEMLREKGLLYSNPHNEIETAMHRTSMGNDADPTSLLLATLRMGVVDGYSGLTLTTDLQDVLFGTPEVHKVEADVGVLEENSVNLAIHGHNPVLSEKIVEWSMKMEDEAKAAGADRINLVGVCCSGNEVTMRHGVPMAAHNLQSELIIATGAIDGMVVDVQCIWPSSSTMSACFDTSFITTDEMVHIPLAKHIEFHHEEADEKAQQIVREAIESFRRRKGKQVHIPSIKNVGFAGLSVEAIVGILSKVDAENPLKPVIDAIVAGNIYGAVGIAGCPGVKFRDTAMTERMIKELLKNNVLVVTTGCTAHISAQEGLLNSAATEEYCGEELKETLRALGNAAGLGAPLPPVWHMGSCVDNSRIMDLLAALAEVLDIKISQLPVAGSAPELVQEKAISIGTWFLAMGLMVHIAPVPHILGSPVVAEVLTRDLEQITGGKAYVEYDPEKAAQGMIAHITEKRKALGI